MIVSDKTEYGYNIFAAQRLVRENHKISPSKIIRVLKVNVMTHLEKCFFPVVQVVYNNLMFYLTDICAIHYIQLND